MSRVRAFVSDTPEYRAAFAAFLAHTDQKERALDWLRKEVAAVPGRGVFVDAGAGTGKLTAALGAGFRRVVAVEPNPALVADLRAACPTADVLPVPILAADPAEPADFVLCSHVFYYVPRAEWAPTFARLVDWLRPGGVLAVAIQNPGTDTMTMADRLVGGRFDIRDLLPGLPAAGYTARVDTVPARVRCPDLPTAVTVAEFLLNVLPMPDAPPLAALSGYIEERFRAPAGGYEWSCDQDFLRVERYG
jgi:SAM-dependent methyltransferase